MHGGRRPKSLEGGNRGGTADVLYFGAWCAAMLLIFSLGLLLPLHPRGRFAWLVTPGLVAAAFGLALLGNIALYRHDAHFDAPSAAVTRRRRSWRRPLTACKAMWF
jgi:hypothetical protein